jgi:DNA-binding transcriptional LysR family regulator
MDLRELRYFVILAEERHFGRAAERLYVAQSGLSKTIRRAEGELGVALFARTRRHVELTTAGTTLLAHARDVMGAFENVERTAAAARGGTVGTLSLATSPVARYNIVAPILQRFTASSPDVQLNRREQLAAELVEDVRTGVVDIGISFCTPGRGGLLYEPLRDVGLRVLVASSHPLANRDRVGLQELRGEHFLMSAPGALARYARAFKAAGFEPRPTADVPEYDEDLNRVRRSEGIVLSPRTFLADPPPGITILELDPPATISVGLVRRAGEPSALLARFIELARQVRAEQGWITTPDDISNH